MFIYYLHGSQLASASSHYRVEPQRDRPLKESAKDIISVFCLTPGLQIISRLARVTLSDQTYFCSDISHLWPDKHRLRLIDIKVPPPPFT